MFIKIFMCLLMLCPLIVCGDSLPIPKLNSARLLLSKVRGGDYLHPGDKEAVDMIIQKLLQIAPEISEEAVLDIGSGLGGTANDIYHLGLQNICGIDIDEAAISYSQVRYPHIKFIHANANAIANLFVQNEFSLITLFNVMYAIEDKPTLLNQIHAITKRGGILVLFDYTSKKGAFPLKDFSGKTIYPLALDVLPDQLKSSGWEILEVTDLSSKYIEWYEHLLNKISQEHEMLAQDFSDEDIARVVVTFHTMLQWLKDSTLGGAVIYAQKSIYTGSTGK